MIRAGDTIPAAADAGSPRAAGHGPHGLPYLHAVVEHRAGQRLVAECLLDVRQHRFLLDHVFFGRNMSVRDRTLTSLPVVPLAMTMEMMAEAAAALHPSRKVVALSEVRTRNWLAFESLTCRMRLEAVCCGEGKVRTTAWRADNPDDELLIAEAVVELADAFPALGSPVVPDRAAAPGGWVPEEIYKRYLYHGPAFQGIVSADRCDGGSIACTLREPDPALLFSGEEHRGLLLPVVLVDVTGQIQGLAVTGFWNESQAEIDVPFPVQIARIEIGPPVPPGTLLHGVCNTRRHGSAVHSHAEVKTADGRVILRVRDRVEQVFCVPTSPHLYWSNPRQLHLSNSLGSLFANVPGIDRCRIRAACRSGGLLLNRIWQRVWASMILNRPERREFAELQESPAGIVAWLLERIASKDAVRELRSLDCCMTDVGIRKAEDGALDTDLPGAVRPRLECAGSLFTAVAVAAEPEAMLGMGIDIQDLRMAASPRVSESVEDCERELVALAAEAADETEAEWMLAVYSAKLSARRALRRIPDPPSSLRVVSVDPAAGRLRLSCNTTGMPSQDILEVYRRTYNNHLVTLCLVPREERFQGDSHDP